MRGDGSESSASSSGPSSPAPPDFSGWSCPAPLRDHPRIVMGHGGGGRLSAELVEHLFRPAFDNPALNDLGDAAVLPWSGGRLAITTDSHVVRPLFFPGGSLGELAVHGTINDLAVVGARPIALTAGFILEEGLEVSVLAALVERMAAAARRAGVTIVAGDTKVVERGHGDGCYITTSGVGMVPPGVELGPRHARPGDRILVSGPIGNHGVAVMSVREGLEFETVIESDTAPLYDLTAAMLEVCPDLRAMRDPTRGGLAASLNEIAASSRVGMLIEESSVPIEPQVAAACDLLGLDPLLVANEGRLVAIAPPERAEALLERMRRDPLGRSAAVIGVVTAEHPGLVAIRTALGSSRVVALPIGEQLPRIC